MAVPEESTDLDKSVIPAKTGSPLWERFDAIDAFITHRMAEWGVPLLRVGLGVIFLWFGALKFFPDASPAEDLVRNTVYFVDPDWFIPVLACWEVAIGIGLLANAWRRLTLLLLFLQMPGTALPLVLLPEVCWSSFPFQLTLEGQYIIKNLVLVSSALVLGGTVRGNYILPDDLPQDFRDQAGKLDGPAG